MNDKDLKYIMMVAEEGSLSKAAARLGRNTSSVSRSVKRVEESLDIQLFRRTTVGLIPTPEGEAYIRMAYDIVKMYDALHEGVPSTLLL